MAYLREVRLDHAHRDLVAADPTMVTVKDVARKWGFARFDRFVSAYRAAYSRHPEGTLSGRD